jgi:hypothetical protein
MKENGAANQPAATPENRAPAAYAERRAYHRHTFSALAEIIEPRTRTRLKCRATDLSFGGIYVDTISPFAVGSQVMVRLSCEGRSFQAGARVTYSLNGMGMGLAFVPDLPVEQANSLNSWIAELSGELNAAPAMDFDTSDTVSGLPVSSAASDSSNSLREGTRALVEMLLHKQILTESEASALRSKLAL